MKVIGESPRTLNPYKAMQVALIAAGDLFLTAAMALFIFLASQAITWIVPALISVAAWIVVNFLIGTEVYYWLGNRAEDWQAGPQD